MYCVLCLEDPVGSLSWLCMVRVMISLVQLSFHSSMICFILVLPLYFCFCHFRTFFKTWSEILHRTSYCSCLDDCFPSSWICFHLLFFSCSSTTHVLIAYCTYRLLHWLPDWLFHDYFLLCPDAFASVAWLC